MSVFLRLLAACASLSLFWATASGVANDDGFPSTPADIRIEIRDGMLLLDAHDTPVHEIVRELGKHAGFQTIMAGDFSSAPTASASFENVTVQKAVERLLSGENRIILYAQTADDDQGHAIEQVWLLGSGSDSAGFEIVEYGGIASGRKTDVEDHKLEKLTRLLQHDENVAVRTRAAMALGVFPGERAVLALESALSDPDSSVRSQAIRALGRMGDERAAMVLGNILLNTATDATDRRMAAQALAMHDSEVARGYLRAGGKTVNEQVRSAPSGPLPSSKAHAQDDRLENADVQ